LYMNKIITYFIYNYSLISLNIIYYELNGLSLKENEFGSTKEFLLNAS
jgi:hypothetical protein